MSNPIRFPAGKVVTRQAAQGDGPKPSTISANGRFVPLHDEKSRPRIVMATKAWEKDGKTHFGLTMPDPIAVMNFNFGLEGVSKKFVKPSEFSKKAKRIDVAAFRFDFNRQAKDLKVEAKALWDQFLHDYSYALTHYRSVFVDTASECREVQIMAHFGRTEMIEPRLYGGPNAEMKDLIDLALESNANVMFAHWLKDEWENYGRLNTKTGEVQQVGRKTGNTTITGWKGITREAQVVVTLSRKDKDGGGSEFSAQIDDCRLDPDLNGLILSGEQATFPILAGLMLPDVPATEWE